MTQTVSLVHVNIYAYQLLSISNAGLLSRLKGHHRVRLDHQLDRRQVIQFSRFGITWERVVVKYETLLTLSGRVEYVRKQLFSISVYHGVLQDPLSIYTQLYTKVDRTQ